MATIPVATSPQSPSTIGDASPAIQELPQGAKGDKVLETNLGAFGSLMTDLGNREQKMLEDQHRVAMLAGLSDLQTKTKAREVQFSAEGTGDTPYVKAVMDDLESHLNDFGKTVPEFLQGEYKLRSLNIIESVSSQALATQARINEDKAKRDSEVFATNLMNQVRFGQLDEKNATLQMEDFGKSLPATIKDDILQNIKGGIRQSTMEKDLAANPAAFMRRAKAGAYNDIDPNAVSRAYDSAARTLLEQQHEAARRMEAARNKMDKDPYTAAQEMLLLSGVRNPTAAQIQAVQVREGRDPTDVVMTPKSELERIYYSVMTSPDQATAMLRREQAIAAAAQRGADVKQLQRDLERMSDAHPAWREFFSVNPVTADPAYVDALVQVGRDKKAADRAKESLSTVAGEQAAQVKKVMNTAIATAVGPQLRLIAASKAGTSSAGESEFSKQARLATDIGAIVFTEVYTRTGDESVAAAAVKKALTSPDADKTYRTNSRDAYVVPKSLEPSLSEQYMESKKAEAIRSSRIPPTYPLGQKGRSDYEADMKRRAGWVSVGPDVVELSVDGAPVMGKDGRVIRRSFTQLSSQYIEEGKHLEESKKNLVPNGALGTLVVGGGQ